MPICLNFLFIVVENIKINFEKILSKNNYYFKRYQELEKICIITLV